jgi:predicted permease
VIAVAAAIVAATAIGIWAEQRRPEQAIALARRLLTWVLYGLLPIITFFNLAHAELDADVGIGIGVAYATVAVIGVLAWLLADRVLGLRRSSTGAVICCSIMGNTAYLGYPVTVTLLGFDHLSEAVVYDICVSAVVFLVAGFAIAAAFGDTAGEGPRQRFRSFLIRNPALYAGIAALIAPEALAPDLMVDASRILVIVMLPIGFYALGATLASEADEGAWVPRPDSAVASAVILRLAIAPALLFGLAWPLIDLPASYLLLAAMPSGINTLIVTHAYGLDARITASAVAWSTGIAVAAATVASLIW